ncbi:MAG: hypothetical protein ACQERK_03675 [Campylobacterota bacterium]
MRSLYIITLLCMPIWSLTLQIAQDSLQAGSEATAVITAEGKEVEFDDIDTIGGYEIESKQIIDNSVFVNNDIVHQKKLTVTFYPTEDFVIEPISAVVEGQKKTTRKKAFTVEKPNKTLKDSYFITMEAEPKSVYVRQGVEVRVKIAELKDKRLLDIAYTPPSKEGFWVKQKGQEKTYTHSKHLVHELTYMYYPQKEGNLSIRGPKARIGIPQIKEDMFGKTIVPKHTTIFADDIQIRAKALPEDATLVGQMNLQVHISSKNPKADEPVHVDFVLQGPGNYDDFAGFDLQIENATVYEGNQIKKADRYQQSYSVVARRDFVIPSQSVTYFDLEAEKIKTIQSKPVEVVIENKKQSPAASHPADTTAADKSGFDTGGFILGALSGLAAAAVLFLFQKKTRKNKKKAPASNLARLFAKCDSPEGYSLCKRAYKKEKGGKKSIFYRQ